MRLGTASSSPKASGNASASNAFGIRTNLVGGGLHVPAWMGRCSLVANRCLFDSRAMNVATGSEDPRGVIDAPIRRELQRMIVRGLFLFLVLAALAVCPLMCALDAGTHDVLAVAALFVLVGYSVLVHARRLHLGPVPEDRREQAWLRAQEVDADDATLGRMVWAWVPVGLLAALVLLLWPHVTDANPALACAWVVIGLPPIVVAWLVASSTWWDAARDDLARAELESDARFRRYWAELRR